MIVFSGYGQSSCGWQDETYVPETISFNTLGIFDRQKYILRHYEKEVVDYHKMKNSAYKELELLNNEN